MAIVFQRQLQCGLADVLFHVDGVQRIVLGPFGHLGQGKDARGQQAAGLQTFAVRVSSSCSISRNVLLSRSIRS